MSITKSDKDKKLSQISLEPFSSTSNNWKAISYASESTGALQTWQRIP